MTDVNKLREEELEMLSKEDEEIFDLESLITDGVDAKIPIIISYPKDGKTVKAGALIRPLSNIEWNNATRLNRAPTSKTTNEVELVKKALYTRSGEQFPPKLVEQLPNGVILELVKQIAHISGVDIDSKENIRMAKEMMGFSN